MDLPVGIGYKETMSLKFKPLSQGLGFHPFSDGLPYSGPQKQVRNAPRYNADLAQNQPNLPNISLQPRSLDQGAPATLAAPHTHSYNILVRRSLAYLLDGAINGALGGGAFVFVLWRLDFDLNLFVVPSILGRVLLFGFFFNWLLVTAQEVLFKTSIGKRCLDLVLHGDTTTIAFRALLCIPSQLFCGIGLVFAFFDSERRCWHDQATGLTPSRIHSISELPHA